nr:MAG TPA: hypothetical protein [Caudoviricetes sp.]
MWHLVVSLQQNQSQKHPGNHIWMNLSLKRSTLVSHSQ